MPHAGGGRGPEEVLEMEHDGFACTLDRADVDRRAALLHDLADQVLEVRRDTRVAILRFPGASHAAVEDFVALESRCCSFFTFTSDRLGPDLTLVVAVPRGAEPLLDGLVEAVHRGATVESRAAAVDRMRGAQA